MGMSFDNDDDIKAEINVTPLVDVMLVLLVIFMISAPLMFNGITMDLPKTKKVNSLNLQSSQIILSISKLEELYIDDQRILENELIVVLKKLMQEKKTESLFIRADENVKYGKVAKVMSELKVNGINSISLVTDIEK